MSPPDCRRCDAATIAIDTGEYAEMVPAETARVTLCTHCLTLEPAPADRAGEDESTGEQKPASRPGTNTSAPVGTNPDHEPAIEQVSERFPTGDAAVPFALLVGLLENLALNRAAVTNLFATIEQAGVDPLARLEQLTHDPGLEPSIDLDGRARQLEQLL